jgi:type II restriction enzyme
MIERITSNENPDFLFLGYDLSAMQVVDLMVIPKYFFVPEIIEKRKPLGPNARRAGWVGCNILLEQIPVQRRIPIVMNCVETPLQEVLAQVQRSNSLKKRRYGVAQLAYGRALLCQCSAGRIFYISKYVCL